MSRKLKNLMILHRCYLQLQWITHNMGLAALDCFVEAGFWLHLAVSVAQDKGCLSCSNTCAVTQTWHNLYIKYYGSPQKFICAWRFNIWIFSYSTYIINDDCA